MVVEGGVGGVGGPSEAVPSLNKRCSMLRLVWQFSVLGCVPMQRICGYCVVALPEQSSRLFQGGGFLGFKVSFKHYLSVATASTDLWPTSQ